jgi:hypothetical protein
MIQGLLIYSQVYTNRLFAHVFIIIITIVKSCSKNWLLITKDATDTYLLTEFINES